MTLILDWHIYTINGNPGGIVFGRNENIIFALLEIENFTKASINLFINENSGL